jgi:hypothetical protein
MSYKNLEIWAMARGLAIDIHNMTFTCRSSSSSKELNKSEGQANLFDPTSLKVTEEDIMKEIILDSLSMLLRRMMKQSTISKLFLKQNRLIMKLSLKTYTVD